MDFKSVFKQNVKHRRGFFVGHYAHFVVRSLFKNIYNLSDIMINGGTRNNRKKSMREIYNLI